MGARRDPFPILRQAGRWLVLLALVLMALVARGTMAVQAADGTMVLVLCTPEGMTEITLGPDGVPLPDLPHGDDPRPAVCGFAVALGASAATPPVGLPLPVAPARISHARWPDAAQPLPGPVPEIPATPRAPPSLA